MMNTKSEVLRIASVLAAANIQAHSTLIAARIARGEPLHDVPEDHEILTDAVADVLKAIEMLNRGRVEKCSEAWVLLD